MSTSIHQMWEYMSREKGPKIFSINDFFGIANPNTIRANLMRLSNEGKIVKLMDGFYAIPEYSQLLKMDVYPNAQDFAKKIADKFGWTIVPTDEAALNALGFSTQIPNQIIFASNGPYRKYDYNGTEIIFKNTSLKYITNMSINTALMVQAMKVIGKDSFREKEMNILKKFYSKNMNKNIMNEISNIPVWMQSKIIEMLGSYNEKIY